MSQPRALIPLALPLALLLGALPGCGQGSWEVSTWGEDFIEAGIPSDVFADGCAVTYQTFLITLTQADLVTGDGEVAAGQEGSQVFDLTQVGPHEVGIYEARADHYDHAIFTIAPDSGASNGNAAQEVASEAREAGASVLVAGTMTCDGRARTFRWAFDTDTTYDCEPEALTLSRGGEAATQLTIHGDHLFYDGLEDPEAQVRGLAIFNADADGDGDITLAELDAVDVAPLGYTVGRYGDVTTLRDFVSHLSRTIGHVDGEGHCGVDF